MSGHRRTVACPEIVPSTPLAPLHSRPSLFSGVVSARTQNRAPPRAKPDSGEERRSPFTDAEKALQLCQ